MTGWQRKGVSRTGSSIWRQTQLPRWSKQSITECKWSSLCQQTSTFSLSWINIGGSQCAGRAACSPTKPCVWRCIPLVLLLQRMSSSSSQRTHRGRRKTTCYQRVRWTLYTKSLTCDPAGWGGERSGTVWRAASWCQEEMDLSKQQYPHSDTEHSYTDRKTSEPRWMEGLTDNLLFSIWRLIFSFSLLVFHSTKYKLTELQ